VKATKRALTMLNDPTVAKLVGTMLSNPSGSYQTALQKTFGNEKIPDKYIELQATLADLTSDIRHARLGGAQTIHEVKNLQPLLADLGDVDARTVRTKLRVLHDKLADDFNAQLSGHTKRGRDVNPDWSPIPLLRDTKAEAEPEAPALPPAVTADGRAPNPIAEAIRAEQARRDRNQRRK
jgi:hypothetical protein